MISSSAMPSAAQRVKSSRRVGVHSSPMATATRKNAMEGLFSSPKPAETPKTVHHSRCEYPRCTSSNASAQVIQKPGSQEFMDRYPPNPMYSGTHNSPNIASA